MNQYSWGVVSDRIVVVVNDEVITDNEIAKRMAPFYKQAEPFQDSPIYGQKMNEARTKVLEQLINDKLVISAAKRKNIEVRDKEILDQVGRVRKQFTTEEEFIKALEEQGMTVESLKTNYRISMMAQKLIDREVRSKIVITPAEQFTFYKENIDLFTMPAEAKVRMITLKKTEEQDPEETRALAEELQKKAVQGEDFDKIAKEYSKDAYAEKGGDMGYVREGDMMKNIDEAIFSLKTGEVSDVMETDLGFHIFKVEDIKRAQTRLFEESSGDIEKEIYHLKMKDKVEQYIEKLKENAYIEFK